LGKRPSNGLNERLGYSTAATVLLAGDSPALWTATTCLRFGFGGRARYSQSLPRSCAARVISVSIAAPTSRYAPAGRSRRESGLLQASPCLRVSVAKNAFEF
jgi:hypothetical protein